MARWAAARQSLTLPRRALGPALNPTSEFSPRMLEGSQALKHGEGACCAVLRELSMIGCAGLRRPYYSICVPDQQHSQVPKRDARV